MANLPPVPYRAPMLDKGGLLTTAWQGFYRQLFTLLGSGTSSSLPTITQDIETLETQVTAAQASIAALQAASGGDFNQGRYL